MAVWPTELPQAQKMASQHRRNPNILRATTGAATSKTRRQFNDAAFQYSSRLVFTEAELAVFWTFFEDTIQGGALPFDWIDPRTGVTKAQIILEPPSFIEVAGGIWEGVGKFEVNI